MDMSEELISKRKREKRCLKANVAQPKGMVTRWAAKVNKIHSNVPNKRVTEPTLHEAIKELHRVVVGVQSVYLSHGVAVVVALGT